MKKIRLSFGYFAKHISAAVGIVLLWRGMWYALDFIDAQIFGGSHIVSAILGIVVGLIILYLPDKNLEGVHKM